jgi:type VI protein secretion system component VasK
MNRDLIRLMVAVGGAWLIGALGGLAIMPYALDLLIVVALIVFLVVTALWTGPVRRDHWAAPELDGSHEAADEVDDAPRDAISARARRAMLRREAAC